mgnify:CR=1 FL=1
MSYVSAIPVAKLAKLGIFMKKVIDPIVDGISKSSKGGRNGWKVGDDIFKPTSKGNEPAWSTTRERYWKNEAAKPNAEDVYDGKANVERMRRGRAPQKYNPRTGKVESMELSHEPIPKRLGGKDTVPRWPDDHAKVDPRRRVKGD